MLKKLFSVITAIAAFSVLMFGAETVTGSSMISVSANAAQTGISIAELDAIKSRSFFGGQQQKLCLSD